MPYTITHRGVPVGEVESLPAGELVTLVVKPLPGYESLRTMVRAASAALANVALPSAAPAVPENQEALRRGAEIGRELELRDSSGALVPADFVELTEWPGGDPEVAALARFRDSHAAVRAVVRRPPGSGAGALHPAA